MTDRLMAAAIVIAALIIGACILFGNRYSFAVGENGVVWRVNRITGETSVCEHGDYNPFCAPALEPVQKPPKKSP